MTSIERDRQRQGPRRGDEALAIPGYRHGFAISFDATRRTVIVGPGIVSIRGELIRQSEESDAKYARFVEPQVASNFFWLYVGPDEPLVVSRQPPVFDSEASSATCIPRTTGWLRSGACTWARTASRYGRTPTFTRSRARCGWERRTGLA